MKRYKDTPYFISVDGEVFRENSKKPLSQEVVKKGYKRVSLSVEGVVSRYFVHRLVAEVYIDNPENKPFINHIDNNPENNKLNNLEWCNQSENMIHCVNQGRCSILKAKKIQSEMFFKKTTEKFQNMLGSNFIKVVNRNPKNYVQFKCFNCDSVHESRIDSETFKREKPVCRKCSYLYR